MMDQMERLCIIMCLVGVGNTIAAAMYLAKFAFFTAML